MPIPTMVDQPKPEANRGFLPVGKNYGGENYLTFENGKKIATPLLMVICPIGLTDVIFAITSDPYIVLTSKVFGILALTILLSVRSAPSQSNS